MSTPADTKHQVPQAAEVSAASAASAEEERELEEFGEDEEAVPHQNSVASSAHGYGRHASYYLVEAAESFGDSLATHSGFSAGQYSGSDGRYSIDKEITLSFKGFATLATISASGCYALRLILRDWIEEMDQFRALSHGKRLVVELYSIGIIHSSAWAVFFLNKVFRGKWDDPTGSTRALCLSAGYYLHELIVLRSFIFRDPLVLLHNVSNLVTHASMLRSVGAQWLTPAMMSHAAPSMPLNLLRILHVLGMHPGATVARAVLVVYVAIFAGTNTIGVPFLAIWNLVMHPKPELNRPSFRSAKIGLLTNLAINHVWFASSVRGAWEALSFAGEDMSLRELRDAALVPLGRALGGLQIVSLLCVYIVGPAMIPVVVLLMRRGNRRLAFPILSALIALTVMPIPKKGRASMTNNRVTNFVIRCIGNYFGFKFVQEGGPLPKDKRYLAALFPHGFLPICMPLIFKKLEEQGFQPNICGASVLLQLPVLRQLLSYMGQRSAERKDVMECLAHPPPHNLTFLFPGGIGEMFCCTRNDVEHILSDRTGFVKCAIESGADIVPIFVLGHTQVYQVLGGTLGRLLEHFSRWARTSILPFHGRWGTPLPFATPLVALVGRPIPVGAGTEGRPASAEAVEEIHRSFTEAIKGLFDRHKHLCDGYAEKELYMGSKAELPPPPTPELAEFTRSSL